jgi:hypothetical protein
MDRDRMLMAVKGLAQPTVALFCPGELPRFEADFAAWALDAGLPRAAEKAAVRKEPERGLDTTLVAGMFFRVLLEASRLPASAPERVAFVRRGAKDFLVNRLAGQITLSQFYRLLSLIEEQAEHYFRSLEEGWLAQGSGLNALPGGETKAAPPAPDPVKAEALRRALAALPLPRKGRRKVTPETLWLFLRDTGGSWFRLLDLEAHFQVDKKTAWSYLNLLLKAGILAHNREKANRVRYMLAPPFLGSGS